MMDGLGPCYEPIIDEKYITVDPTDEYEFRVNMWLSDDEDVLCVDDLE